MYPEKHADISENPFVSINIEMTEKNSLEEKTAEHIKYHPNRNRFFHHDDSKLNLRSTPKNLRQRRNLPLLKDLSKISLLERNIHEGIKITRRNNYLIFRKACREIFLAVCGLMLPIIGLNLFFYGNKKAVESECPGFNDFNFYCDIIGSINSTRVNNTNINDTSVSCATSVVQMWCNGRISDILGVLAVCFDMPFFLMMILYGGQTIRSSYKSLESIRKNLSEEVIAEFKNISGIEIININKNLLNSILKERKEDILQKYARIRSEGFAFFHAANELHIQTFLNKDMRHLVFEYMGCPEITEYLPSGHSQATVTLQSTRSM
jgi:hypothetical protein